MGASHGGGEATTRAPGETEASVGEILRLLSAGATGAILIALCEGPMQTKVLTHRVRGYTARTVYRYLPRLAQLGLVQRDDEPGGRARVVHTLSEDEGAEICELIDRFAKASMTQLPDGGIRPDAWASLALLADLWEAGVVEELSRGPKSPTELARGLDALSYHQLSRRASQFETSGFFATASSTPQQRHRYSLTPKARRTMGLIAGIGRWRRRHLAIAGGTGLTAEEMATVLRVVFPLAKGEDGPEVLVEVADESICCRDGGANWATGDVEDWMAVLLDGELQVEAGGSPRAVKSCLAALYDALWAPSPF